MGLWISALDSQIHIWSSARLLCKLEYPTNCQRVCNKWVVIVHPLTKFRATAIKMRDCECRAQTNLIRFKLLDKHTRAHISSGLSLRLRPTAWSSVWLEMWCCGLEANRQARSGAPLKRTMIVIKYDFHLTSLAWSNVIGQRAVIAITWTIFNCFKTIETEKEEEAGID